jgi:hypothetical protein
MLEQLITHKSVVDFCANIKSLKLNQYAKLCGIDYFMENLAFKLYIELKEAPSKEMCQTFLQNESMVNLFLQNLPYWKPERVSSLAFGIKIDNNFNVRTYFHIKFDENYVFENPNINLLTRFKAIGVDFNKRLKGMSAEYNLNTSELVDKNYYYVTNKAEILKILGYENISKESYIISDLKELEIYTTPSLYKINIIKKLFFEDVMNSKPYLTVNENQDKDVLKHAAYKLIPLEYHEKVKSHSEQLKLNPYFVGLTSDKKRISVYFSLTKEKDNILGI